MATKKPVGVSSSAAVADRRSTANIAAPKTLPRAQVQKVTSLPGVVTDVAATNKRVAAEQPVSYGQASQSMPAAITPDVSVETLTKTPEYLARERAIQSAMDLFGANQATESARYNEGYGKSLTQLGYDPTKGFDRGALMSSGERATASGKAYNTLSNDFAARGMLQSGAYQAQQGVLGTQLEDQRLAIDKGKLQFGEDQQAKLRAQQSQNEQARIQALSDAKSALLERYAMGA
jgi:hypothetical protein